MSKIHVFTDADLDGAGCVFLLKHAFPNSEITYKATTEKSFRADILNWQLTHSFKDYDKVFVCDLNIKDETSLVDDSNIIVFDHHMDHVEVKDEYVKAKAVVEDYPSCTLLMYEKLNLKDKLTDYQKLLVKLINDYDSWTLDLPFSKPLNFIFWNYTGDRVGKFIADFNEGFKGFTQLHKNVLNIIEKRIVDYFETAKFYMNELEFSGKKYKVLGGFFSFSPNELSQTALQKYDADVCFLINSKSKSVIFRRSEGCDLSMRKLAANLADGGGHDDAAGAVLNDNIMKLTKLLKEVDNA